MKTVKVMFLLFYWEKKNKKANKSEFCPGTAADKFFQYDIMGKKNITVQKPKVIKYLL